MTRPMSEIVELQAIIAEQAAEIARLISVIRSLRMRLEDTEEALRLVNDEGVKAW